MTDTTAINSTINTGTLRNYFFESLTALCERRHVKTSESCIAYMVNLLDHYVRSDNLFEWNQQSGYGVQPLAFLYGDAVKAKAPGQRAAALRRLGDVALFISGVFNASLTRKSVGLNYYINMGGGAYGWLSDDLESSRSSTMDHEVFRELSTRFSELVNVLDEFTDSTELRGDKDLISLYELWLESSDPVTAERIAQKGVPVSSVSNRKTH